MRRRAALAALLVGIVMAHPVAASATPPATPELELVEDCPAGYFGVTATVTGLAPGDQVLGSVAGTNADGSGGFGAGPALFMADAAGTVGPTFVGSSAPLSVITVTVVLDLNRNGRQDPDEPVLSASREHPCEGPAAPTAKAQCKLGGFAAFGFSNQGRCVSFLQGTRR